MLMGVAFAVHGQSLRSHCKPAKSEIGTFESELQLDGTSLQLQLQPGRTTRGKLLISVCDQPIVYYGMRVQLEAYVRLKFETKEDSCSVKHSKVQSILPNSPDLEFYYTPSPISVQVIESDEENQVEYPLEPGSYTFPFELPIPRDPLPASFRSQYGFLQYKIVAYMKSSDLYVQVAEKLIRFRGYNNLNDNPTALCPIRKEGGLSNSIFSSKKVIISILHVKKAGFLYGEKIPFKLDIINPKNLAVRRGTVTLFRRVTYIINGARKTMLVTLDTFEINEMTAETEIKWNAKLTIPRNCVPSYNGKPLYTVSHFIKYEVKVADYPGYLKGQADIIIGTTRDPIVEIGSGSRQTNLTGETDPRKRSDSVLSRLSEISISSAATVVTLPPAYSELSSRAVSRLSLETLPPHYDDVTL